MKNIIKVVVYIFLIITLSINVVTRNYNNFLVLGVLSGALIFEFIIDGYRTFNRRHILTVLFVIFLGAFITLSTYYLFGTFDEFTRNLNFAGYKYIKTSAWISVFAIVILTELIRYIAMNAPKGTKLKETIINIILFVFFVMIDVCLCYKNVDIKSFNSIYDFFALTLCPSLTKNIFLMWVTKKNGYYPCLLYRVMMDLYVYLLPVVPKTNMLIQACMFMLLPFILYKIIDGIEKERELPPAHEVVKHRFDKIEAAILIIIFAILAGLVSREFKYSMIGVGSESMTGTIYKGDAIIYEKYRGQPLNEGDIIVFKIENVMIVHRINRRIFVGDDYGYITKGDFNKTEDNWIVQSNMVIGVYKQKIRYIAWPSVWINEHF